MRPALVAVALVGLSTACFCGPNDPVPERSLCDDPVATAAVTSIAVDGRVEYGGQGTTMLMFDVTYAGDAPACATLGYTVVDPATGDELGADTLGVETVDGRTRTSYWRTWEWDWPGELLLRVEAYGQTAETRVCDPACAAPDAG